MYFNAISDETLDRKAIIGLAPEGNNGLHDVKRLPNTQKDFSRFQYTSRNCGNFMRLQDRRLQCNPLDRLHF
jgi:hypothetical protein